MLFLEPKLTTPDFGDESDLEEEDRLKKQEKTKEKDDKEQQPDDSEEGSFEDDDVHKQKEVTKEKDACPECQLSDDFMLQVGQMCKKMGIKKEWKKFGGLMNRSQNGKYHVDYMVPVPYDPKQQSLSNEWIVMIKNLQVVPDFIAEFIRFFQMSYILPPWIQTFFSCGTGIAGAVPHAHAKPTPLTFEIGSPIGSAFQCLFTLAAMPWIPSLADMVMYFWWAVIPKCHNEIWDVQISGFRVRVVEVSVDKRVVPDDHQRLIRFLAKVYIIAARVHARVNNFFGIKR